MAQQKPSIHPEVSALTHDLQNHIVTFVNAYRGYQASRAELSRFVRLDYESSSLAGIAESMIERWIDNVCEKTNQQTANRSELRITRSLLPEPFKKVRLRRPELVCDDRGAEAIASQIMTLFDGEAFEQALHELSQSIEAMGFNKAAGAIGYEFDLIQRFSGCSGTVSVKHQKGRYILEFYNPSDCQFTRVSNIRNFAEHASAFEMESGLDGLAECLDRCIEEKQRQPGFDRAVPTRTKVNAGRNVEAVFFSNKIKLHCNPDIFEALVSFVAQYTTSDEPIKTIEIK